MVSEELKERWSRIQDEIATVKDVYWWLMGPGRDRNREGDDSARKTRQAILRSRGWTMAQVEQRAMDYQTSMHPPGPPPKARSGSSISGSASTGPWEQRVTNWVFLERSYAEPPPATTEEAQRLAGNIRKALKGWGVEDPLAGIEERFKPDPAGSVRAPSHPDDQDPEWL